MTTGDDMGPFQIGDLIDGKYLVVGKLGRGGHAYVYDCVDIFMGQEVAVKVVEWWENRGPDAVMRALNEARVLYRLTHPNIVKVVSGGWLGGNRLYFAMERLEGIDLRRMLKRFGRLSVYETLSIAFQIADALVTAHAGKDHPRPEERVPPLIHRDLKPENIFIQYPFSVKVLDFGIAKALHGDLYATQKGLVHGTAPYLSPEQAEGLNVSFPSDVFQLGGLMYEMITGMCPCLVGVEDPTPRAILAIQIHKLPPRPNKMVPGIPDHFDRLVWRAIAKDPKHRYQQMSEFKKAIHRSLALHYQQLSETERMVRVLEPLPRKPHPALLAAREQKLVPPRSQAHAQARPIDNVHAAPPATSTQPLTTTPIALSRSAPEQASEEDTANITDPARAVEILKEDDTDQMSPAEISAIERVRMSPRHERDAPQATLNGRSPSARPSVREWFRSQDAEAAEVDARPAPAMFVSVPAKAVEQAHSFRRARKALHRALVRASLIGLGVALPLGTYIGLSHRSELEPSTPVASARSSARGEVATAKPPLAQAAPIATSVVAATQSPPAVAAPESPPAAAPESVQDPSRVPAVAPQADAARSLPSAATAGARPSATRPKRKNPADASGGLSPESERVRRNARRLAEDLAHAGPIAPRVPAATSSTPVNHEKPWLEPLFR